MPNFNITGVTAENLDEFIKAVIQFGARKGEVAASRWLTKLNPEVRRHLDMEYTSCGDGYTRSMARRLVLGEFDHQPLPVLCPECGEGVCWYRATASVLKCDTCGEITLDRENGYLDERIEDYRKAVA